MLQILKYFRRDYAAITEIFAATLSSLACRGTAKNSNFLLFLVSMHIRTVVNFFKFNTYFSSVVPTALLLQCNWPITGIRRVL